MPGNSAEYMRAYRARRKKATGDERTLAAMRALQDCSIERDQLTEEVAQLKRELAARAVPTYTYHPAGQGPTRNPYTEFRPVPKSKR